MLRRVFAQLSADRGPWVRLLLAWAVVFGLRWHTVDQVVVDWDESIYFVMTQDWLRGGTMYVTTWDHKGPLLWLVFAPVISLFGANVVALRLFTTGLLLLTMLLFELTARRLVGRQWSFVAALVYGLFFCVPHFGGLASNGELVMLLPVAASLLCLVLSRQERRVGWWLATSGASAAMAVLVKPTAAYSLVVVPLMLLAQELLNRPSDARRLARQLGLLGAGFTAVIGATAGLLAVHGALAECVHANIVFGYQYVSSIPAEDAWSWVPPFLTWAVLGDPFTAMAVGSLLLLLAKRRELAGDGWLAVLVVLLIFTSFSGFTLGRRMFFHYYLQMALPFGLVIAWACARVALSERDGSRLAAVGLVLAVASAFSPYRSLGGERTRSREADTVLREVAALVRQNTRPDDSIFVLGGEPVVYFLSERRPASRYFVWFHSGDDYDALLGSRRQVLADLSLHPPRCIVYRPAAPRIPELERFMAEHYTLTQTVGDYQLMRRN